VAAQHALGQLQVAEPKSEASFMARTNAAEERLREVSLAVAALEARVGTLAEDFRGRIEGTLQAFQGKSARQAKDLEKIAQLLGQRWFRQFQEQADAAVERLREEAKKSAQALAESKQELASLTEARLASLSPEVAEQPVGQAQVGEEQRERGFLAQVEAAEERLKGVSSAVEALEARVGALAEDFQGRIESTLQAFQGKGAGQAEDLEKIAQEVGGRNSQQFQEQVDAAVKRLELAEQERQTGFVAQAEAAEERLRGVSSAVEALEGRVGALTEDFQGRIEGTLQASHGKGARQAKDLEKVAQEVGGRWSQQFQEQAGAAMKRLEVAEQKRETGFVAQAEAAEERLRGVSSAVEALEGRVGTLVEDFQGRIEGTLQAFQGKGAKQAEDLEKIAQEVGGRWSQQFQEQVGAAAKRLREELENSGRVVEEGKQQLASLAKAKLASLSQAAQEECGEQLAQAFREHAQEMHEAAKVEVESIRETAERAIAQLRVAEEQRETGFLAQAETAEERLKGVSSAVEALEGRVGTLVEDFRGRIEGALKGFHGKGARQADDLEKIAQEVGGRWSQQFKEQAEAAAKRLQEELENLRQVVEEGKQQLAGLAGAKLASLTQPMQEEFGQQLAQASQQHAQAMREAAKVEVESIRETAERAIGQLRVAEEQRETGFLAQAEAAEERLKEVSSAVEALETRVGALAEDFRGRIESTLQAFQGKGAGQTEDLDKIAQEVGGRWSQQFKEQAEAAAKRLQEELENSRRVVEESKQQLASFAKARLTVLSQVADSAAAGLEAEQRRLKNEYEVSRRELEDRLEMGWTRPPSPSLQYADQPRWRGTTAQLALLGGVCLVVLIPLLGVYLSTRPVMRLQVETPAQLVDQNPNWNAKRRAREEAVAQACWRVAVASLQQKYPFGSELPAEPPSEFQIENKYVPPFSAKALSETRAHYWEKLRRIWVQRQSWEERHEWNTQWAAPFRHIWQRLCSLR
jgi:hypothetical protein